MSRWHPVAERARTSLVTLALSLCLCLALLVLSQHWNLRERQALEVAQRELAGQRSTLSLRQADLAYLQRHAEQFRQLARLGLTRPAQREAWVAQLLASLQRTGLPDTLRYSLHPAKPVSRSTALDPEAADAGQVLASFHELEFTLVGIHEEELLALLQDYADHVPGRFRVNACELAQPTIGGLTAQCTLRFFTVSTDRTVAAAP